MVLLQISRFSSRLRHNSKSASGDKSAKAPSGRQLQLDSLEVEAPENECIHGATMVQFKAKINTFVIYFKVCFNNDKVSSKLH